MGAMKNRVLIASLLCVLAAPAMAQKTTGDITGTVTDATGGVLPGVTVTARCQDTGATRTVTTDAAGGYTLPELAVCVYKVTAEIAGFKVITRDVQVAVNAVSKSDFRLEVGTQSETITVQGVSPLIEFSDKLNNNVDKERIDSIPLSGRDFNSLLAVTPGVQREPGGGFLAVSISGARRTSNNYMIDGISNNDRYYGDSVLNQTGVVGVPATLVPMDAIAEFTVQQTPSAEFGVKGGGAINVVMKSGGNTPHGTAYYFRHDDWTDSPNYFVEKDGGSTTPIKNQQYGGTFGGPIARDKTFFFGYYEGQRLAVTSPYQASVPTPGDITAARARIASRGLTTSSIGENFLKFYPTDPSGNLTINSANVANMNTFAVKVDHQVNVNNLINGRFFFGNSYQSAPATVGELTPANGPADMFNSVTDPTRVALVGAVWNSTLSDKSLLQVRFGYNRISQTIDVNNKIDPASLGLNTGPLDPIDFGVPALNLGSFGYIGGVGGYPITTSPTETYDISGSLTQTRGAHTLKAGGTWDLGKNYSLRNRARTSLTANGGGSFDNVDSIVELLLGRFDTASRSFGSTARNMSQTAFGMYVNDDWKASSRVTISLGLRYDIVAPLKEANNLASLFVPGQGLVQLGHGLDQLYPVDKNNFGPRAGIAWDVNGDGRTSVRAGYALTYDTVDFKTLHSPNTTWSGFGASAGAMSNPDQGVFSVALNGTQTVAPDAASATCINPNNPSAGGNFICAQPGVALFGNSPTGQPPYNAFAVSSDYHTPMYHYFHTTLQRELFPRNAITVTYIGSRGMDQSWARDINAPPLGTPTSAIQQNRPFNAQFPTLKHIVELTNDGRSWYNALQLSYKQQGWHGIDTQYNYTLSKCEDYNSDNSRGRNDFPQADNPYNPAANKGPCGFDRRHNFNVAGVYAVPGTNAVTRGLQVGTVFTALTGRPFTPNLSNRDQSGQDIAAIRANCSGDFAYDFTNPDGIISNLPPLSGRQSTNGSLLLSTPAAGTLGTCGRNNARLPGLAQWDLNIIKEFKLQGNTRIQARWEIFNLLNRVNLGALQSTNIRSGAFGTIGSTPDVDAGNPVVAQGGPRAMQWALKVLF